LGARRKEKKFRTVEVGRTTSGKPRNKADFEKMAITERRGNCDVRRGDNRNPILKFVLSSEISVSDGGEYEDGRLLGCCAVRSP
jgi:hypothetical protein